MVHRANPMKTTYSTVKISINYRSNTNDRKYRAKRIMCKTFGAFKCSDDLYMVSRPASEVHFNCATEEVDEQIKA